MKVTRSIKRARRIRPNRAEFVETYVSNHILFYGEPPTEDDIERSWNISKMQRENRRRKARISKPEFIEAFHQNSSVMFGESPNEEAANKAWDIREFPRLVKLQPKTERAAFCQRWMESMVSRYSPAAIEEGRMEKQKDLHNEPSATTEADYEDMNMPSDHVPVVKSRTL